MISLDGKTAQCFTGTACEESEGKMSHPQPLCLTASGGVSALPAGNGVGGGEQDTATWE